jgi:serine/threonine protein kinase
MASSVPLAGADTRGALNVVSPTGKKPTEADSGSDNDNAEQRQDAPMHPELQQGLPVGTQLFVVNHTDLAAAFEHASRTGSNTKVVRMMLEGRTVAVKKFLLYNQAHKMTEAEFVGAMRFTITELQAARRATRLRHVVQYLGVILKEVALASGKRYLAPMYIVMEFAEGQTLDHLMTNERLEPAEFEAIVVGILHGVAELHFVGLVHNDLHANNIIVGRNGGKPVVTILDLGECSSYVGGDSGPGPATAWAVAAPDHGTTPAKDVFAVAVHVAQYLAGVHGYPLDNSANMPQRVQWMRRIAQQTFDTRPPEWHRLAQVIRGCSDEDGLHRPSARTVLELLDPATNANFMSVLTVPTLELLRLLRNELSDGNAVPGVRDVPIAGGQQHQTAEVARQLLEKVIRAIQATPRTASSTTKFCGICHTLASIMIALQTDNEALAFAHEAIAYVEWRMHGKEHHERCLAEFAKAAAYLHKVPEGVTKFAFRLAMGDMYRAATVHDLEAHNAARIRARLSAPNRATAPREAVGAFDVDFGLFFCDALYSTALRHSANDPTLSPPERLVILKAAYEVSIDVEKRLNDTTIEPTLRMRSLIHIQLAATCTELALTTKELATREAEGFWNEAEWHIDQAVNKCEEMCYDRGIAIAMNWQVIAFANRRDFQRALDTTTHMLVLLAAAGEEHVPERAVYAANNVLARVALAYIRCEDAAAELDNIADRLPVDEPMLYAPLISKIRANAQRLRGTDGGFDNFEFIKWFC